MRMALLSLLPLAALAADWDSKPYPDWSDGAVLRLLTDSPWSKPHSAPIQWTKREERPFTYKDVPGADPTPGPPVGSPVGGIGKAKSHLPDRADIIIRWASALPVRQAVALYRQRDERADATRRNEWIGVPPEDYIIELFGVPAEVGHRGAESVAAILRGSMVMRLQSGRELRPRHVAVSTQGLTLKILAHFPRSAPITLADKEVEISADVQLFGFRERFKLSQMLYQKRLEL